MNKRQFFDWLKLQDCNIIPKEGVNNSAPPIEIVNQKTGRYIYFAMPIRDDIVPRKSIEKIISDLGIQPPKGF